MHLHESFLNNNLTYFHGSSKHIEILDFPSAYRPLFITPNIEFAMQYAKVGQKETRSDFSIEFPEEQRHIYQIDVNLNNSKILDCTKDSDVYKLAKYFPKYFLDNVLSQEYSIWSIFKYLNSHFYKFYREFLDIHKYFIYLKSINFLDHFGNDEFKKGFIFLIQNFDKLYKIIYQKNKSEQNCLYDLISSFNILLYNLGFNGFSNIEKIDLKNNISIKSTSIGLFNQHCLNSLIPKELNYKKIEKTLKIMDGFFKIHPNSFIDQKDKIFNKLYSII